jgi:hypothetical protein
MSDAPQGPGWWQASDHKWYPPEQWTGPPAQMPSAIVPDDGQLGVGASSPVLAPVAHVSTRCGSCSKQLAAGSSFCSGCGAPVNAQVSRHQSQLDAKSSPVGGRRAALILGIAVTVAAVTAVGALLLMGGGSGGNDESAATTSPPTTEQSLASRTTELGDQIDAILCGTAVCVDSTVPGVIRIDTKPGGEYGTNLLTDDSDLESVATSTGVWSVADAIRMGQTRALDGTRESADGAVSWTYHPDSGLDIVIDVETVAAKD